MKNRVTYNVFFCLCHLIMTCPPVASTTTLAMKTSATSRYFILRATQVDSSHHRKKVIWRMQWKWSLWKRRKVKIFYWIIYSKSWSTYKNSHEKMRQTFYQVLTSMGELNTSITLTVGNTHLFQTLGQFTSKLHDHTSSRYAFSSAPAGVCAHT